MMIVTMRAILCALSHDHIEFYCTPREIDSKETKVGEQGIEPWLHDPQPRILPLNHSPNIEVILTRKAREIRKSGNSRVVAS